MKWLKWVFIISFILLIIVWYFLITPFSVSSAPGTKEYDRWHDPNSSAYFWEDVLMLLRHILIWVTYLSGAIWLVWKVKMNNPHNDDQTTGVMRSLKLVCVLCFVLWVGMELFSWAYALALDSSLLFLYCYDAVCLLLLLTMVITGVIWLANAIGKKR